MFAGGGTAVPPVPCSPSRAAGFCGVACIRYKGEGKSFCFALTFPLYGGVLCCGLVTYG